MMLSVDGMTAAPADAHERAAGDELLGLEANADSVEAIANSTRPTTRASRRPKRSPSTPYVNSSPANTSV
jgi:hypothetical protein